MQNGTNRSMNRFIRRVLYSLKRQYGGRVDIYKLSDTETDYESGVKSYVRTMVTIRKCPVLPAKIQREAVQTISIISANKAFVYGGSYDAGTRTFIVDARDLPDDYEIVKDDWFIYNSRRYELKSILEFEQHTGWIVVGREVKGVRPEQILHLKVENWLDMNQTVVRS